MPIEGGGAGLCDPSTLRSPKNVMIRPSSGADFGEILGMKDKRPGFPGLSALFTGRANGI